MRICFVAASRLTIDNFLKEHALALHKLHDVTVVFNDTDNSVPNIEGITFINVGIERKISIGNDLKALFSLFRLFKKNKYDAVHSVTPKAGLLAMSAAALAGIPIRIHIFTGQVWVTRSGFSRFFLKQIDWLLAKFTTHTLADSFSQRDFLISQGVILPQKSMVLADGSISGVDVKKFSFDPGSRSSIRAELGIDSDSCVFLYLGRLCRDKGLLELGHAFSLLNKMYPATNLIIAGPDEEGLSPAIKELCRPCADKVQFLPYTTCPEKLMSAADVFCLPSYREGFGTVIIEAAAIGIPAIGTRIYGISDAIEENVTGLLFEKGNVDQLVEKMSLFTQEPETRKAMGKNAQERVQSLFSREKVTSAWVDFYTSLK